MTLESPRKAKGIALKAIKEKVLNSKSEDDEKMSKGEITRFARKFKKYMKFRKFENWYQSQSHGFEPQECHVREGIVGVQ